MSSEEPEIEIGPVQSPKRRELPRPSAPAAVIGEVGEVSEGREIFVHVQAIEAIVESLGGQQQRVEVGGLLVGAEGHDEAGLYLVISGAIAAQAAASSAVSVTFGHDTWDQLLAEKAAQHPEEAVVGWYHSHPGLGVFLSEQDLFIHRSFFADATHVALVVDPADFTWGIFYWQGQDLVVAQGCYIYGEPGEDYPHLGEVLGDYRMDGTQR